MDVDQVLSKFGEIGCNQLLVYNLYSLLGISTAFHHLMQVFTGGVSQHWCNFDSNITADDSNITADDSNITADGRYWKAFIPTDDPNTYVNEQQCMQYSDYENTENSTNLIKCENGYAFDHSRYTSTIQEDFLLVCDDKVKTALAQSIYFTGVLVGSLVFGSLADRIGRKPTIMICVFLQSALGTLTAFVNSFEMYAFLRFLTATSAMGIFLIDFTIVSELAGIKWRTRSVTILGSYWAIGLMILPGVAYFVRDWRNLHIALSVPTFFALLYLPFLPESPRWLLSKGRVLKAETTLRKLVKKNEMLPKGSFLASSIEKTKCEDIRIYTAVDLFRHRKLCIYTLTIMFSWFVVVMVYFGIAINSSGLGVDPYLSFMINGFLEHPANILTLILIDKFGRRSVTCVVMLLSTASCLTAGFLKPGVILVTVVMLGKFAVSCAFGSIYVHSAEIFPTPVRSAGMGVASMAGRLGSVFSPMILLLSEWWQPLPILVFSFLSFVCSLVCLILPETVGKELPQKMDVYSTSTRSVEMVSTTDDIITENEKA